MGVDSQSRNTRGTSGEHAHDTGALPARSRSAKGERKARHRRRAGSAQAQRRRNTNVKKKIIYIYICGTGALRSCTRAKGARSRHSTSAAKARGKHGGGQAATVDTRAHSVQIIQAHFAPKHRVKRCAKNVLKG